MNRKRISLKQAIEFHGHLGPYLVLGIIAGETALKVLKCKKYFNLSVRVWGAGKKPKSCLIDGLQLSTGATYGKGNINKFNGSVIKMEFKSRANSGALLLKLNRGLIKIIDQAKTHRDSEVLAKKLYNRHYSELFDIWPSQV